MRNGIIDTVEMASIVKSLDKIEVLFAKYEFSPPPSLKIDKRITLEYTSFRGKCYICVNGIRVIKYNLGFFGSLSRAVASGFTLGVIKSYIRFIVNDKNIVNHKFVKEISELLKESLPKIENDLKLASKKRWE